jgi:hypothetical protein
MRKRDKYIAFGKNNMGKMKNLVLKETKRMRKRERWKNERGRLKEIESYNRNTKKEKTVIY